MKCPPKMLLALAFALFCWCGTPRSAAAVTVRGVVTAEGSGVGLYSHVVAYSWATGLVVANDGTSFEGLVSFNVPPGAYGFYVRAFGYKPVDLGPYTITTDVQLTFWVQAVRATVPTYLTDARLADMAVFKDGADTTTFTLASTRSLGRTVYLFNEFAALTADGASLAKIRLYDDGTHGDARADDFVYSRSGLGYNGELGFRSGIGGALCLYIQTPDSGNQILNIPEGGMIGVNPESREEVRTLNAQVQYTPFAANIVLPQATSTWQQAASRIFLQYFEDRYDFMYFFTHQLDPFEGLAGYATIVRNSVQGIGLPNGDNSADYGSHGKLQAAFSFPPGSDPPLLHESMHRWAAYLDRVLPTTCEPHWGYSGVNGVLGGFDPATLVQKGPRTYGVGIVAECGWKSDFMRYSPLELYLAGFADLPPDFSVPVMINPRDSTSVPGAFDVDELRYVTRAQIVAAYGAREPAATNAQRAFNGAFIGVSTSRLNAASMAYLSILARTLGGVTDVSEPSFAEATGNRATMNCAISRIP